MKDNVKSIPQSTEVKSNTFFIAETDGKKVKVAKDTVLEAAQDYSTTNRGYKLYLATLSQSSTNAPTEAKVFLNELTGTVNFYYDAVGIYRIGCTDFGLKADDNVHVIISTPNQNHGSKVVDAYTTSAPVGRDPNTANLEIALESFNAGVATDGQMYETAIEIKVFA